MNKKIANELVKIAKGLIAEDIGQATKKYADFLQDLTKKEYAKSPNLMVPEIKISEGGRFFKVFRTEGTVSKSVVAFVDKATGDIFKPATWNAPAKHARGNVLKDETWKSHSWHGPHYLK